MKESLFKRLIVDCKMVLTVPGCHWGKCPICEKDDFRIWAAIPIHAAYANCGGCGRSYSEAELECQMRLKAQAKTLGQPMRWQKEPPKIIGYWWVGKRNRAGAMLANIIEVRHHKKQWQWSHFGTGMTWNPTKNYPEYEWAGPIEPPKI